MSNKTQIEPDYTDEELFKMAGMHPRNRDRSHNDISAGTYTGNIIRGVGSEAINKVGNLVNFITQGDAGNNIKQYADSPEQLDQMPGAAIGKFATDVGINLPAGGAGALVRGGGMLMPWMARAAASALTEGATAEGDNIDRAQAAGWGAAGSAGGDVLGTILGRLINPALKVHPDAQTLIDNGVNLTPGQMAGPGNLKSLEDSLSSVPFVGGQVAARRMEALHIFNKTEIEKALEPIGVRIPANVTPGFNSIDHAHDAISKVYSDNLSDVSVQFPEPDFKSLSDTGAKTQLPKPYFNRFQSTVDNVLHPLKDSATPNSQGIIGVTGNVYKLVISNLNNKIRKFNSSTDPLDDDIAEHLMRVKDNLNAALYKPNNFSNAAGDDPSNTLAALTRADTAFAKMVPIDRAASVQGSPNGVFTPHALYNSIRGTTGNSQTIARGAGYNQRYAAQARNILPSTVPDSGTAGRAMVANLLGGMGLGSATGVGGLTGLATGAGLTALGTRMAQDNIVKPWLYNPSFLRTNAANLTDQLLRATGAANGERSQQLFTTGR
jgi:hypothetical protein